MMQTSSNETKEQGKGTSERDHSDVSSNDSCNHEAAPEDIWETVEIDSLKDGFSWSKYVTTVTLPDKWITVEEDYIPTNSDIDDNYVVARCNYLGVETTPEEKKRLKESCSPINRPSALH